MPTLLEAVISSPAADKDAKELARNIKESSHTILDMLKRPDITLSHAQWQAISIWESHLNAKLPKGVLK